MAYLYRHIRKDKNQVFYVGIGSDSEGKFKRAYAKKGRNTHWERIVSKTDYTVEIIFDDFIWDEACEKEKEFIKLYGRRDLGLGTLVNMTDGGDGQLGAIYSPETRDRLRVANIGRKLSEQTITKREFTKANKTLEEKAETKAKLRSAKIGKRQPAEQKEKRVYTRKANNSIWHSEETRAKMSKPKSKVECPHCGKEGGSNVMERWHFNNCKFKLI